MARPLTPDEINEVKRAYGDTQFMYRDVHWYIRCLIRNVEELQAALERLSGKKGRPGS